MVMAKERTKGRFVRFPASLDRWMTEYAAKNDFSSQAELVRDVMRDFKQSCESDLKSQIKPRLVDKASA
jgi:Arc/MetJ-type ribon-helix-helix transcriptional regulator